MRAWRSWEGRAPQFEVGGVMTATAGRIVYASAGLLLVAAGLLAIWGQEVLPFLEDVVWRLFTGWFT